MFCCDFVVGIYLDTEAYPVIGGNKAGNAVGLYSNGVYVVNMRHAYGYIADAPSNIGATLSLHDFLSVK